MDFAEKLRKKAGGAFLDFPRFALAQSEILKFCEDLFKVRTLFYF